MSGPLDISLIISALIWYFSGYKTEMALFWFFILYTIGYALAVDSVQAGDQQRILQYLS